MRAGGWGGGGRPRDPAHRNQVPHLPGARFGEIRAWAGRGWSAGARRGVFARPGKQGALPIAPSLHPAGGPPRTLSAPPCGLLGRRGKSGLGVLGPVVAPSHFWGKKGSLSFRPGEKKTAPGNLKNQKNRKPLQRAKMGVGSSGEAGPPPGSAGAWVSQASPLSMWKDPLSKKHKTAIYQVRRG